jgi:hypothetical protein
LGIGGMITIFVWPAPRGIEWSFEVSDAGSADGENVHRAAISVGHTMHDEFDLATDE